VFYNIRDKTRIIADQHADPTVADAHPQDEHQEGFEHHVITDDTLQQKESARNVSGGDDSRVEANGGVLAHGSTEELQYTA
jgi:hypothetical protein